MRAGAGDIASFQYVMKNITVSPLEAGQRFDKFLLKLLPSAGKGFIYKMLRKKNFTLNGAKASGSEILTSGDEVCLYISDDTYEKFTAVQSGKVSGVKLDIIYEDEDILIINKPAGMLSQKASPGDVSLCEYICEYMRQSGAGDEYFRAFTPGVCNRLDRNTSGLITSGKTLKGLQILSEGFRDRTIDKYYTAIVCGRFEAFLRHTGYAVKDAASNKVTIHDSEVPDSEYVSTEFEPVSYNNNYTVLSVKLITGKTHQIRAVLAHLGFPIAGDSKYGGKGPAKRQLLHCSRIVFPKDFALDKVAGLTVTAPLPADMTEFTQR